MKILLFGKKILLLAKAIKTFLRHLGQKSDNLYKFLIKFNSKNKYYIYLTLLTLNSRQKQFTPKVTKLCSYCLIKFVNEHITDTSLNYHMPLNYEFRRT